MTASVDARDRTLGMASMWDLLRKFQWELHLVDAIPDKVRIGTQPNSPLEYRDAALYGLINASLTSLAMLDWLEILVRDVNYRSRLELRYPSLVGVSSKLLKKSMRELEPALQLCHQIGNAFKHRELASYDPDVKVHAFDIVAEDEDGNAWISHGGLVIAPSGGRLDQILCGHFDWWFELLRDLHLPES